MPTPSPTQITARLLVTLGILSALAPLSTDFYLAAFPAMAAQLGASASEVQLSLTAFFVGAGLGQLAFGPWSDRIGRKGPLIAGMVVFVAASVAAAFAPSIWLLVAARGIQGLGGAAGMVISRAMVADLAHGRAAARALSLMMLIGGVAPVAGPIAGALLAEPVGWRGLLTILAALGAVTFVLVIVFLPETHGPERRANRSARPPARVIAAQLTSREYLGAVATLALSFATMMAYISASPFVYQDMIGLSTPVYGLAFGVTAITMVTCGAVSARLVESMGRHRLISRALTVSLAAIVVEAALVLTTDASWLWVVPIVVAVGPLGFVLGNVTSFALDASRSAAGLGSAVLGMCQFLLAGAVAPLVGIAGEDTAIPMVVIMLAASALANVVFRTALRAPGGLEDARQSITAASEGGVAAVRRSDELRDRARPDARG